MCRKIIILILLITYIFLNTIEIEDNRNNNKTISVEVRGDIKEEKLLNLPLGSNINDLFNEIEFNDTSDTKNINLNHVLFNNEIIEIPSINKESIYPISINSADLDELILLPGIGEEIAKRIIEYREKIGSFNIVEDLKNVKGIGTKKFESIKELLTL